MPNQYSNNELRKGEQFRNWTVLSFSHKGSNGNWYYNCKCSCGNKQAVKASNLRTGKSSSCKSCVAKANGRKGLNIQAKQDLYIIKCGKYIKIGSTDNIERRLKNIQHSNPFKITLLYHGVGLGYLESTLHNIHKDDHHHGEWFHLR
jgi:hypothetical protein